MTVLEWGSTSEGVHYLELGGIAALASAAVLYKLALRSCKDCYLLDLDTGVLSAYRSIFGRPGKTKVLATPDTTQSVAICLEHFDVHQHYAVALKVDDGLIQITEYSPYREKAEGLANELTAILGVPRSEDLTTVETKYKLLRRL